MPYSEDITMAGKIPFVAEKLRLRDMRTMSLDTFENTYSTVSENNHAWFNEHAPDKNVSWMYVTRGGKIWGYGSGNMIPSAYQVKEASELVKTPLFLLRRSPQYRDTAFFVPESHSKQIGEIFDREPEDFRDYKDLEAGIFYINAQSGLVNNLNRALFAVGRLSKRQPLVEVGRLSRRKNKSVKGVKYKCHATVTDITNVGWLLECETLHIGSQNTDEVHARRSKVTTERAQEAGKSVTRIERLHRVDDPIIDIFDTYNIKSKGWHPLVLHGSIEDFGIEDSDTRRPKHFDWMPLYEPLEK